MNDSSTQHPMSILEIVGTGWRLYTSHFSEYAAIALRGMLWIFWPTLLLTALLLWILNRGIGLGDFSGLSALAIPAWIVLLLWCRAQSLGHLAGISRLAYHRLAYHRLADQRLSMNDPVGREASAIARRFTHARRFSLLGAGLIQGLILGAATAVFCLAFSLAVGITFAGIGMVPGAEPSVSLFFLGGGGMLISVAIFAGTYVWLAIRLMLAEQALSIEADSAEADSAETDSAETNLGAITRPVLRSFAAVGRSWQITHRHSLRSTCVVMLALLISLPIGVITWLTAQNISHRVFMSVGVVLNRAESSSVDVLPLAISSLIGILTGMVSGVMTQPFFRTVLTTLYFDIRNRKDNIRAARTVSRRPEKNR